MIDVEHHALADAYTARTATMTVTFKNIVPNLGSYLGALVGCPNDLPAAYFHAQFDTLVANERGRPCDELGNLMLRLAAERTSERRRRRRFNAQIAAAHDAPPQTPVPIGITDMTDMTDFPYEALPARAHV